MRQKFTITVADIPMNIVCEESKETVDAAVTALDAQIRAMSASSGNSCTRTEAALLAALDATAQCIHLRERVKELEEIVHRADPIGDTFEAGMLRGENETLRAELQVSRGTYDALLQDNATLFGLNAKLVRQNSEANARGDRMHDQVLSILTEVRELREKLAAMCVDTREPSAAYLTREEEATVEVTPLEQQTTRKYEQMDIGDLLADAPRQAPRPAVPAEDSALRIADMLDIQGE